MSVKQFLLSVSIFTLFAIGCIFFFSSKDNSNNSNLSSLSSPEEISNTDLNKYQSNYTELKHSQKLLECIFELDIDFNQLICTQIIVVKSYNTQANIFCCEKNSNGIWTDVTEFNFDGYIGKNGATENKIEGDKKTPIGLYPIMFAFGTHTDINVAIDYRSISDKSYWVDDPASKFYNQWVESENDRDWESAEHLIEYEKQYEYAVVIGYNQNPIVSDKGSAIFLHCGNAPTAGCVATDKANIIKILYWLDESKLPYILIL